jgi:hypothetical protein
MVFKFCCGPIGLRILSVCKLTEFQLQLWSSSNEFIDTVRFNEYLSISFTDIESPVFGMCPALYTLKTTFEDFEQRYLNIYPIEGRKYKYSKLINYGSL